jgi:outer membrane protein OmpA-like peptidoglycan-associated protein
MIGKDLDTKIKLVKIIMVETNYEKDFHFQADLYKLTNKSLNKLVRFLEAIKSNTIKGEK